MRQTNVIRLNQNDISHYRQLMKLFANEFDDQESYQNNLPSDTYVRQLLSNQDIIFLIEQRQQEVVGGLVAYVLRKFEQQRSEVYLYDLAVHSDFRRQGIASRLIDALKPIAKAAGAWVIFVQADHGDEPAIKLYESIGVKEEVLHFDIKP